MTFRCSAHAMSILASANSNGSRSRLALTTRRGRNAMRQKQWRNLPTSRERRRRRVRRCSTMKANYFDEPELEFGNNGRQIDVRFGLTHFGPLDAGTTGRQGIRVGVVGDNYTNDLFHTFVDTARKGIEAKLSTLPTLYPA